MYFEKWKRYNVNNTGSNGYCNVYFGRGGYLQRYGIHKYLKENSIYIRNGNDTSKSKCDLRKRKSSKEDKDYYDALGRDINAVDQTKLNVALGGTPKEGFRCFKPNDLKMLDLENINQDVIINYDTREVISLTGIEIDGKMYYKLKDVPNYIGYNVDYTPQSTASPTFTVEQTKLDNSKYRFAVKDIKYGGNVEGGTVSYKLHSDTNWILNGTNTSFVVDRPGLYDIKFTDKVGKSTVVQKWVYVEDGMVLYLDGENNTGTGHSNSTTTWKDLSGNGNNGAINGCEWSEKALEFNGTTDWVNLGEMNSTSQSIEIVIDSSSTAVQYIVGNWESGGGGIFINGNIRGEFYINNKYNGVITKKSYKMGKIYHIILTYDGNIVKIFLNGNLENSINAVGDIKPPANNTVMAIGFNPQGNSTRIRIF